MGVSLGHPQSLCVMPGRRNVFSLRWCKAGACWLPLPQDRDGGRCCPMPMGAPNTSQLQTCLLLPPCLPALATPLGSSLTRAIWASPCLSSLFQDRKRWFRFASINIPPSLSAWLSSHLMLGWCQVRLHESEDGLAAAQGLQPQ